MRAQGERGQAAEQRSAPAPEGVSSRLGDLAPLRLLGLGLAISWDWLVSEHLAFGGAQPVGSVASLNTFVVIAQVLALFALAAGSARLQAISRHRWILAASALCGVLGPALWVLLTGPVGLPATGAAGPAGAVVAAVPGVLIGLSMAVLALAWAEAYGRLGPDGVILYGTASLVTAAVTYVVVSQFNEGARLVATACVPLLSHGLCALSLAYVGGEDVEGRRGMRFTFPLKPVLVMAVCGFAAMFVDVSLFMQGTLPRVAANCLVGVALGIAALLPRRRARMTHLVMAALACMAAGILAVALMGRDAAFVASLLTMTSYVAVTFFVCYLLAAMCWRRGVPSLWLFGLALGARVVAEHAGGFARMVFPQLADTAARQLDLAVMAVVGIIAIGVVALAWTTERSLDSDWPVHGVDVEHGGPVRSEREVEASGAERVARRSQLSEREAEVLGMLVDGRTYQQIGAVLFLSHNTVKSHVHRIYGKLGVHSRDELMSLVREAGRE